MSTSRPSRSYSHPEHELEAAIKLYASGLSFPDIEAQTGIPGNTVRYHMRQRGEPRRPVRKYVGKPTKGLGVARPARYKVANGTKPCTLCKQVQDVACFRPMKTTTLDGQPQYQPWCFPCEKDYYRRRHLAQKYGLSLAEYEGLVEAQDGRCFICKQAAELAVDHDHKSGKRRRLLCIHCNTGLGMFKDSAPLLRAAAEYLDAMG